MLVLIEVNMDRGMDEGKLLEGLHVSELRHGRFSSSEGWCGLCHINFVSRRLVIFNGSQAAALAVSQGEDPRTAQKTGAGCVAKARSTALAEIRQLKIWPPDCRYSMPNS